MTKKGINIPERKGIRTQRMKKGSAIWSPPKEVKKMEQDVEYKSPRITVIIPCSNQFAKVSAASNNVFPQLGKYDQMIIADQGSIDGTNPSMFPEDSKVTYLRYPKTNAPEIINFCIINIVQTKHVLLLDSRSELTKGFLDILKSSFIEGKRFLLGKNTGTAYAKKPIVTEHQNSYTGYAFLKNDAIKAGLFDIGYGQSPALFVEKMKNQGIEPTFNDDLVIHTEYREMKSFNKEAFDGIERKYTNYNKLKLGLEPVTFISVDKQKAHLNELLNQLVQPEDEIKRLNATTPATLLKKFNNAVAKAKHGNIIVVKGTLNEPLTYDPITSLRLMFDKNRVLQSNLEQGVECVAFHKGIYTKPSEEMHVDALIRFITKKASKSIELINVTEHHKRVNVEEIMKGGEIVKENVGPKAETIRRKRGQETVWVPKGKGRRKRLKQIKKEKHKKGVSKVGIPNYAMKWKSVNELPKIPGIETRRPKILLISDVKGWAWHYKSQQLKKYLSDEFNIDICWLLGPRASRIKPKSHDLYVTFGYSYIDYLKAVAPRKKITGITAHRPHSVLVPQMRKAAVVHANSMMLFKELQTMHNIVYYLPNGVDEQMFTPYDILKKRDNIVVGHVGKLSVMKGQDKYIKPAIQQAGAEAKFHFNDYTNALPLQQMPQVYQGMDVFIVASKEDGTPNPALEAAACGIPIISNRIGNMPEFIRDGYNGFLVEKNINAYVEKIKYLKNNRGKLVEMGKNARKTVEEGWTWKIQVENYRRMFKEVLGIRGEK